MNIDVLLMMLRIYVMLLGLMFGIASSIYTVILSCINHIMDNEISYLSKVAANPTFPLQLGFFVDK